MVASVNSALEDSDDGPGLSGINNNKHGGDDGEIIHSEFILSDEDDGASDPDSDGVETSDEEVKIAREDLLRLKRKQKELAKKSQLEKIARERSNVRKSLDKLEGRGNKDKKNVTIRSLRKMDDVVEEVDKLMDKNLKFKCVESSVSDASSASDSEAEGRKAPSEKRPKTSHRSGKSKSITSYVKFPQEWPHSHLSLHFVNRKKSYEELNISEFCAGYTTILEITKGTEKAHRISHLKELMYLSTKFTWKSILNYHGACLMEIERGHLSWGDSFLILQSTTLAGSSLSSNYNGGYNSRAGGFSSTAGAGKVEGTIFCKNYQRGTCPQTRDHYGLFYGENRLLKHICATCWQKERKSVNHPETADECPFKG